MMTLAAPARPAYTAAERRSDAVVHVAGLAIVAGAVPAVIALAALRRGDAASVVGASVYGATLIAMILCSALYNMVRRPGWTGLLRRLDHSAIYFKIAGTYTPFTLMSGGQGAGLLTGLWCAAFAGAGLKMVAPQRFRLAGIALCLGMGWAGLVAGQPLLAALPASVVILIVTGGVLYTVGVAFFLADRLRFHYTIWHIFVLAASMVLYAAVVVQVVA